MIDGCLRMVCGFGTMEMKNPIVIYDKTFRPVIAKYGIWNQLRIDHSKEFVLTIFIQELIKSYCYSRNKTPGNKPLQHTIILLKDSGPK